MLLINGQKKIENGWKEYFSVLLNGDYDRKPNVVPFIRSVLMCTVENKEI